MGRGVVTLGLGDPDEAEPSPDDTGAGPSPISGPAAPPRSRPGGMAVSAVLHALIVAMVVQIVIVHAPEAPRPALSRTPRADAVFLPPPAAVRKMLGLRPLPAPRPAAPKEKDRISIGAPAPMRSPDVLHLNRDDDLTKSAKGLPTASQAPRPPMPEPAPAAAPARSAGASLAEDGRLAPNPLTAGRPGPILASLRRLEASGIGDPGPLGVVSGTGGQMGPLFFDPQGADFTEWIQRFKNEVYRNWIPPPSRPRRAQRPRGQPAAPAARGLRAGHGHDEGGVRLQRAPARGRAQRPLGRASAPPAMPAEPAVALALVLS